MLDKDLAMLYGVEVKVLNQAVKRNIERFPNDFRFQLTKEECLRSQIVTLNEKQGQHLKYMPYAFTEQGVAMPNTIDDDVYHIGASIKDLGKKWFGFSKMEMLTRNELVNRINKLITSTKKIYRLHHSSHCEEH